MKTILSAFFIISAVVVNAHFQIQFPNTRGPFVEDDEPTFCDGFVNVTTNRTQFPLSGGVVTIRSEHPKWSAAFFVSKPNIGNPNSFDDFSQVNSFFSLEGEGDFCIPLNLASSNVTGLESGQNVTIQMLFDGGDSPLFQCADLTLTNDDSSIASVDCKNSSSGSDSGNSGNSGNSTGSGDSGDSGALGVAEALSGNLKLLIILGVFSLIPLFV